MKRQVWSLKPCFQYTRWKQMAVATWQSHRELTVIIIINMSRNTVICCDRWSSLRVRQTGKRGGLEARLIELPLAWWMVEPDKGSTVISCWCFACSSGAFPLLAADFCGRRISFRQWWVISLSHSFFREIFAQLKWLQLFDADGCLGLIPDFWLLLQKATFNSPLLLFAFKHFPDLDSSYKLASCLCWAGALWVNLTDVAAWFLPHQPRPVQLNFNKCRRCISPQPLRTVQAGKLWSASSLAVIDVGAISEAALT